MFERKELKTLIKRIAEPRKFIQIVMGPRQVGKTTMLRQLSQQLKVPVLFESADAISASDTNRLEQIWESARLQMKTKSANEFILIPHNNPKTFQQSEVPGTKQCTVECTKYKDIQ